jgi:hypothetical protein
MPTFHLQYLFLLTPSNGFRAAKIKSLFSILQIFGENFSRNSSGQRKNSAYLFQPPTMNLINRCCIAELAFKRLNLLTSSVKVKV